MLIKRAAENDKMQKVLEKWVSSKMSNVYIRLDDSLKKCDFKYNWLTQTN